MTVDSAVKTILKNNPNAVIVLRARNGEVTDIVDITEDLHLITTMALNAIGQLNDNKIIPAWFDIMRIQMFLAALEQGDFNKMKEAKTWGP